MAVFIDTCDRDVRLTGGCACGAHANRATRDAAHGHDSDALAAQTVDAAVMRTLFPVDAAPRRFLDVVGINTEMAAVSRLFPLVAAREAFAQGPGR